MKQAEKLALSRRSFLKHGTLAGIAIVATGFVSYAIAAKLTKASVHYQVGLKNKPDCDDCQHYIASKSSKLHSTCQIVEGDINPHGWCTSFIPKNA
jgi:hypothetical protein